MAESERIFQQLRERQKRRDFAFGFLWMTAGSGAITGLIAGAQGYAIGAGPAWTLYGRWWVAGPLVLPTVFIIILLLAGLGEHVAGWMRTFRVGRVFLRIANHTGLIVGGGYALWALVLVVRGTYDTTRKRVSPPTSSTVETVKSIQSAADRQAVATRELSVGTRKVLADLEETSTRVQQVRRTLEATLPELDAREVRTREIQSEVEGLIEQQQMAQIRNEQLRKLLGDEVPLTVGYFNRSNLESLFEGAVLGVILSHAAQWLLAKIRRRPAVTSE